MDTKSHHVEMDLMKTLDKIVPALNNLLESTALSDFYPLRIRLKQLSPQANRHGLLQHTYAGNQPFSGYSFHNGGRGELQYNVGFEDDRYFRYGVAFSLEPSQNHPDPLTPLAPRIARFNEVFAQFPALKDLSLWAYDKTDRHDLGSVGPIPADLLQSGNFIFIGERVDALEGVTPAMLQRAAEVMASLLPLYQAIETEADAASVWKVARLCWNVNLWQRPSGKVGKTTNTGAFEQQHGFGHEEWLFDFSSPGAGEWKYGFVQALNHSHRTQAGKVINLLLYAINDKTRQRYWVAGVKNLHVLTQEESEAARAMLQRNGTLKQMRDQVRSMDLDPATLDADDPVEIVNLKYRRNDLVLFEPPIPFATGILPADYYGILQNAPEPPDILVRRAEAEASADADTDETIERGIYALTAQRAAYVADTTIDLVQKRWQTELRATLAGVLPRALIQVEAIRSRHAVDLIIEQDGRCIFVELKTVSSVRQAVREAIGQLLEYCYRPPGKPRADALLIVAAGIPDSTDLEYLGLLREHLNIPVHYLQYLDGQIVGIAELVARLTTAG